jgi:hypothetical protein
MLHLLAINFPVFSSPAIPANPIQARTLMAGKSEQRRFIPNSYLLVIHLPVIFSPRGCCLALI